MRGRLGTLGLLGLGVAATAALAGCSSGSSDGSTKHTTTTTHHSTTTTTAKSSTTTTTAPPTTTTAPVTTTSRPSPTTAPTTTTPQTTTCQVSQLQVSPGTPNGAAGTIYFSFVFTNTSPSTCTLNGYPGMQLLDASGNNLPTNVIRGGVTFGTPAANQPPSTVTLAPQQQAVFDGSYSDVPSGNETSCPTSASTLITPPNDFSSATVTFQSTACGGNIHVSPVFASS